MIKVPSARQHRLPAYDAASTPARSDREERAGVEGQWRGAATNSVNLRRSSKSASALRRVRLDQAANLATWPTEDSPNGKGHPRPLTYRPRRVWRSPRTRAVEPPSRDLDHCA